MRLLFITLLALAVSFTARAQEYRQVETRKNATVKEWTAYPTRTLDRLKGFKARKTDPATDQYGGWKSTTYEATGCPGGEVWFDGELGRCRNGPSPFPGL